jgi:hypothetical protein
MTEPVKIQYSLKPQSDTELGPLTATPSGVAGAACCVHRSSLACLALARDARVESREQRAREVQRRPAAVVVYWGRGKRH